MTSTPGRRKRLVVALGGNALIDRDRPLDAEPQRLRVLRAIEKLAPLAAEHDLVITHGNGPQVGLLALESSTDTTIAHSYPLDTLVAETQGLIGYWLLQALHNQLAGRQIAVIITQTLVSAADPAFDDPTKFIGPTYNAERGHALAAERGWSVKQDGNAWRRVVASPTPEGIVEIELVEYLLCSGAIVVCGGGGGIPVVRSPTGSLDGVEAVVDKDLTSAMIATAIDADALLLLTNVPAISTDIEDPAAPNITRTTPGDLRKRQFPPGSMGPKVDAACRFVENDGGLAAIGALEDAPRILAGDAGTLITLTGRYP